MYIIYLKRLEKCWSRSDIFYIPKQASVVLGKANRVDEQRQNGVVVSLSLMYNTVCI